MIRCHWAGWPPSRTLSLKQVIQEILGRQFVRCTEHDLFNSTDALIEPHESNGEAAAYID